MIRINKPPAPAVLHNEGRTATQAFCDAHDRGERAFKFDTTIYADATVKRVLRQLQHDKCAFCESKFAHIGFGDVEHFRPKAGFVQQEGDPLEQPGYFWLAYEWSNLFLSCQLCNQRFKRNLFPLRNPRRRARCHHDDLNAEKPLLLDPGSTSPTRHIGFRGETAYAINGSKAAQTTIEVLGLNRSELVEFRRTHLALIGAVRVAIRALQKLQAVQPLSPEEHANLTKHQALLAALDDENSAYTSMSRSALRQTS